MPCKRMYIYGFLRREREEKTPACLHIKSDNNQQMKREGSVYFIEKLTVGLWLFSVFPYLFKSQPKNPSLLLYYLYASRLGLLTARWTSRFLSAKLESFDFHLAELRDQDGDSIWWAALYEDSIALQEHLKGHFEFQKIIKEYQQENKMLLFLTGKLLIFDEHLFGLIKILIFLRVAAQKQDSLRQYPARIFFLSSERPWAEELKKWAQKRNVDLILIEEKFSFNIRKMALKSGALKNFLKKTLYYSMAIKHWLQNRSSQEVPSAGPTSAAPKLAVEFFGHLNLTSPHLQSDLFFCRYSKIPREDVLIYFSYPAYPLTDSKLKEIRSEKMSAVILNSRATKTTEAPLFIYRPRRIENGYFKDAHDEGNDPCIRKHLYGQVVNYQEQCDYWVNFFTKYNIKVHVSWYRYEAKCFPLADALRKTGGVGVIYQRSFDHRSNSWHSVAIDVSFGFSRQAFQTVDDPHSIIPYYVIAGYLPDYRFSFVRKDAGMIKSQLRRQGAEKIIAYFDENSGDDPRWTLGHRSTQENYEYLLNKVLQNPKFGLILKPKVPGTLKRRLGEIWSLLEVARATGRCVVLDEGDLLGSHPPATAALAADVVVHGHLHGGTAGIEAALTGTPTLMLDREGWSKSPLYALGEGRVVFKSWNDLWRACRDHWSAPDGMPGFGDWSPMIDDIDPFRDGRAAERMGTYLEWLMEGFKANLPREIVLADAAERYSKIWGKDKVLSVNCDSKEYASVS